MQFVNSFADWEHLLLMHGDEVGQYMHCVTVFRKRQCEQLQAGLVGQWWPVIHERCVENWLLRNSKEVGFNEVEKKA